ncbi:MAG: helix-turn-helix transcriptional regulator [Pseudomonadota bacterium]
MHDPIAENVTIDDSQRLVWQRAVSAKKSANARALKLGDYAISFSDPVCEKYDGFPLSEREKQVLLMSSCGLTGREISGEIGVSLNTVATYKRRIMFKLGCRSMPEATALGTAYLFGACVKPWVAPEPSTQAQRPQA